MKLTRSNNLIRCALASILLSCLYLGNVLFGLNMGITPAIAILILLGIFGLINTFGLWQAQRWTWHSSHVFALLGIVLGLVGVVDRFRGGLLDLTSATLLIVLGAILIYFVRTKDVKRSLRH
jgi:uncharacterized membrane protein (DUF2068 family)